MLLSSLMGLAADGGLPPRSPNSRCRKGALGDANLRKRAVTLFLPTCDERAVTQFTWL